MNIKEFKIWKNGFMDAVFLQGRDDINLDEANYIISKLNEIVDEKPVEEKPDLDKQLRDIMEDNPWKPMEGPKIPNPWDNPGPYYAPATPLIDPFNPNEITCKGYPLISGYISTTNGTEFQLQKDDK